VNELKFEGISFPFTASQLPLFERLNPGLVITLLQWKDDEARLVRSAPLSETRQVVHVLLVKDHYVGVSNLDRLLNSHNNSHHHNSRYYCERCLRPFFTKEKRTEHKPFCMRNKPQHYVMPKEKEYAFGSWGKTLSPGYVIYADIECLLEPGLDNNLQSHKPIAAGYIVVPNASIQDVEPRYRSFLGRSCITEFMASIEWEVNALCEWMDNNSHKVMKALTALQKITYESATCCYMCKKAFTDNKVRDHDHLTGEYRGPACSRCNLSARMRRMTVPIIFHNWKGYDSHHIVREGVTTRPHWRLEVIATTSESYLTMKASWGEKGEQRRKIRFIDSLQFLPSSLANLVKQCPIMPLTESLPWPSSITKGKGVFPYSFLDSVTKLDANSLPNREAFYDCLSQSTISEVDYNRAQDAWSLMECKTFGEYMMSKCFS
jgi:hypothetical protein